MGHSECTEGDRFFCYFIFRLLHNPISDHNSNFKRSLTYETYEIGNLRYMFSLLVLSHIQVYENGFSPTKPIKQTFIRFSSARHLFARMHFQVGSWFFRESSAKKTFLMNLHSKLNQQIEIWNQQAKKLKKYCIQSWNNLHKCKRNGNDFFHCF